MVKRAVREATPNPDFELKAVRQSPLCRRAAKPIGFDRRYSVALRRCLSGRSRLA